MCVDVFERLLHGESEQNQLAEVVPAVLALLFVRREARSCHVGAADGFNLLHLLEIALLQQLIKFGDDAIEEAETLDGLIYVVLLSEEVRETLQRGEEDADSIVRL